MFIIKRKVSFSSAHRLYSDALSDEENQAVYGKCSNPNYHGHNFSLEVAVEGEPDPRTGMVINFKTLGEILEREVVEQLDHRNLNLEVDWLRGVVPTAENLVRAIWEILEGKIPQGQLHSLTLSETESSSVTYFGPRGGTPGQ